MREAVIQIRDEATDTVAGAPHRVSHYLNGEDRLRSGAGDKLYTLLCIKEKEAEKDTSSIIQDMVAKESELQKINLVCRDRI